MEQRSQQPASMAVLGDTTGVENASPHPQRYGEERVRLPEDPDAKLAFLRKVIAEGERRGWKLISAIREPDGEGLLVTWDTSGSSV